MRRLWKDHKASVVLTLLSIFFAVVTIVTGYHYWKVEGPKAHGPFWNWLIHHSFIGMLDEVFMGGLVMIHLFKLREKNSPETGDK